MIFYSSFGEDFLWPAVAMLVIELFGLLLKFPDFTPLFDMFKNPDLINDEEIEKEFERTKVLFNRRLEEIYNKGGVKKF